MCPLGRLVHLPREAATSSLLDDFVFGAVSGAFDCVGGTCSEPPLVVLAVGLFSVVFGGGGVVFIELVHAPLVVGPLGWARIVTSRLSVAVVRCVGLNVHDGFILEPSLSLINVSSSLVGLFLTTSFPLWDGFRVVQLTGESFDGGVLDLVPESAFSSDGPCSMALMFLCCLLSRTS